MIYLTKGLGQIDMPDGATDDGRLASHVLWIYRNLDAINDDITAAISAAAPSIQDSWVKIALDYLHRVGAIVIDGGAEDDR